MRLVIFQILALFCFQAYGANYTLVTGDVPPFASEKTRSGTAIDYVKDTLTRVQIKPDLKFIPWARAVVTVSSAKPTEKLLITPLTRTPEREAKFDWIAKIFSYQLVLVTNRPNVKISDLRNIENLDICAIRRSPAQMQSKKLKARSVVLASGAPKCMELLALKRVDAVLSHGENMAKHNYALVKENKPPLIFGHKFGKFDVYLGSTKGVFTKEQIEKIKAAFLNNPSNI